jgi:hypothetical protein
VKPVRTQIDLCEQQAEWEVLARKEQFESEVRTSLGLPEKPVLVDVTAERFGQASTSQGQVPNITKLDRLVALALAGRRNTCRASAKSLRGRLTRRRRLAGSANREQVGLTLRPPAAPNVVLFPGRKN